MDRRSFLVGSVALAAAGFHARLLAAPALPGDGRLLVVFLRGAYDAASALVPIHNDFYYASRPTQAVPRPDASCPQAAVCLDDDWGLHPAIASGLGPLLTRGEVTFVPFAGVPGASRSHFQVQDQVEAGDDGLGTPRHADGLLYRLATQVGVDRAISYTPTLPNILRGDEPVGNVRLQKGGHRILPADEKAELESLYVGHHLGDMLATADALQRDAADGQAMDDRYRVAGPGKGPGAAEQFRRQAAKMARYLARDHRLAFVDIAGWDTHAAQGSNGGHLTRQFAGLSEGLAIFAGAMGEAWRDTTVVVLSEFGRTFRENGNGGTDHGHGSVFWVLGGKVSGKPVRGPRIVLSAETLNEQRDYPVLVDYRALLADAAALTFGLDDRTLASVFGVAPTTLLRG